MPEREPRAGRSKHPPPLLMTSAIESAQALRERALDQMQATAAQDEDNLDTLSPDAIRRMMHELRVHQIELELQNDELRRAQEELEGSRARYFDLYDLAPVGYLTIGEQGLVVEANLNAAGLLGVTRNTLVKQPWTRFIFPDDQDVYTMHRRLLSSSGASQVCELRLLRDGQPFWSRLDARAAHGADGVPVYRTAMIDVTERRRSEDALSASESRHRVLFENSHDALMTMAPPAWQFTSGNATTLALFAAPSREQFLTQGFWDYSPERQPDGRFSKEKAMAMIAAAMSRGSHAFEWCYRRPRGDEFSAAVVLVRMQANGASLLQATVRDESEARRQELALAQTERLASMGMLAASVGHEINNPLSYVLSNIESLAKTLPGLAAAAERCRPALRSALSEAAFTAIVGEDAALLEPETFRELSSRARDALDGAQRLKCISKVLNEFARIDSLDLSRVDIQHSIESAISMAANELRFGTTLVRDFRQVPHVWASDGKLSQVFLNLLINASHAMADVQAKDRHITVRTWAEAGSVFAEIADTGAGIRPADLRHIFDPFFSTKPLGRGSGLGLAVCRNIMVEFGGTIQVESEVGKGSRFVVQVPALEALLPTPQQVRPNSESAQFPALHGRILIVDDELQLCTIMKRLLPEHEVVTCSSGAAAQALLDQDQNFDVILCDLMMPEMTGMDVHRWLLARNPTLASHLVFVTGGVFSPVAQEYLTQSGISKIDKPFDNEEFVRVVSERLVVAKSEPPAAAHP